MSHIDLASTLEPVLTVNSHLCYKHICRRTGNQGVAGLLRTLLENATALYYLEYNLLNLNRTGL